MEHQSWKKKEKHQLNQRQHKVETELEQRSSRLETWSTSANANGATWLTSLRRAGRHRSTWTDAYQLGELQLQQESTFQQYHTLHNQRKKLPKKQSGHPQFLTNYT
jgi:hypothetical protein